MATKAIEHARRIRHLVAALPHADVHAALTAFNSLAAVLTEVDRAFPDPMKRAMASDAQRLAQLFQDANVARGVIPTGTAPTLTVPERDYLISLVSGDMDPSEHQASLLAKLSGNEHRTVR